MRCFTIAPVMTHHPSSSPHCTTRPTGTRSSPRRSWPTSPRPARSSGATGYGRPTSSLADLGLPEGVRDVVGRRLSRLTEATNDLLSVAAVVGREFDLSTVAVAAGVAPAVAALAFDEAARPGLLREVPERSRHARVHARAGAPDPSRGDQRSPPSPSALADRRSARGLGERPARCHRTPPVRGGPGRRSAHRSGGGRGRGRGSGCDRSIGRGR